MVRSWRVCKCVSVHAEVEEMVGVYEATGVVLKRDWDVTCSGFTVTAEKS